jgi:ATP-dependent exoDNAse (exonuclease V) alpha subunit
MLIINEIKLTEEQQQVADNIDLFLNSNDQIFTLKGVAGAGKTTVLKSILKSYNNIVAATVSHVAKSVLETVIGDIATCMTIAKLLNMRQVISEDGEVSFLPRIVSQQTEFRLPIEDADILVIDECSMIDNSTHGMILRYKKSSAKIIYLGDSSQLSPVSHNNTDLDSITFNFTKGELLKAVRYGGIISDLGERIRQEINKINNGKAGSKYLLNEWSEESGDSQRTSRLDENGNGIIYLNDIQDVINITKHHYNLSEDSNEMRLIGYRRKTVELLNKEMRLKLYHEKLRISNYDDFPQFIEGEIIVNDGGYKNGIVHNNETFKVVSSKEIIGPLEIPCLSLKLDPDPVANSAEQIIVINDKKGRIKYNAILSQLKLNAQNDKRQWKDYYRFIETFCRFEYSIALNSHRS